MHNNIRCITKSGGGGNHCKSERQSFFFFSCIICSTWNRHRCVVTAFLHNKCSDFNTIVLCSYINVATQRKTMQNSIHSLNTDDDTSQTAPAQQTPHSAHIPITLHILICTTKMHVWILPRSSVVAAPHFYCYLFAWKVRIHGTYATITNASTFRNGVFICTISAWTLEGWEGESASLHLSWSLVLARTTQNILSVYSLCCIFHQNISAQQHSDYVIYIDRINA